ncbi:MAG: RNA polymerase sigma factor [Pirellulales bacterium]
MTSPTPPPDASPILTVEDRHLLDACLAGTRSGWEAFIARFAGLFAYVAAQTARQRGFALSASDRDDAVAEILLECLRNDTAVLRGFAGRSSLPTYLTVIARRVAVRHILAAPRLATGPVAEGRSHGHPAHRAAEDDRDEAARLADRQHVESLLGVLDHDEARLVRLHHLEERSYGEINHLTGMPLGSIGPALSRAREKMRQADSATR